MSLREETPAAPSVDVLLADGWTPIETEGFIGLIGPMLYREEGASIRFGFLAEMKHENNGRGVVQGGMIAAFADRSLAMACQKANNYVPQATIVLNVRMLDAVHVGEFVQMGSEVVRKTRSVVFMRGTLTVGARIVATADGIWKLLGPRQAS
jgi:acyl-coenzyme A thioesterase PaaI-like protein